MTRTGLPIAYVSERAFPGLSFPRRGRTRALQADCPKKSFAFEDEGEITRSPSSRALRAALRAHSRLPPPSGAVPPGRAHILCARGRSGAWFVDVARRRLVARPTTYGWSAKHGTTLPTSRCWANWLSGCRARCAARAPCRTRTRSGGATYRAELRARWWTRPTDSGATDVSFLRHHPALATPGPTHRYATPACT